MFRKWIVAALPIFLAACPQLLSDDFVVREDAGVPSPDGGGDGRTIVSSREDGMGLPIVDATVESSPPGDATEPTAQDAPPQLERDASDAQTPEAATAPVDAAPDVDAYDCNLTCALSCSLLAMPMHACCSPREQCNCTTADASGYCASN